MVIILAGHVDVWRCGAEYYDPFHSIGNIQNELSHKMIVAVLHCVSKSPPPHFELSVTLSNLNRFSIFLRCGKAYEICYKTHRQYPPHLRHVTTLPREIKKSIF